MHGMSTYELQVSTKLRQYRMQAAATARRSDTRPPAADAFDAASDANRRS
jgi:hypothetical protein